MQYYNSPDVRIQSIQYLFIYNNVIIWGASDIHRAIIVLQEDVLGDGCFVIAECASKQWD